MRRKISSLVVTSVLSLLLVGCGGYSSKLNSTEVAQKINSYSLEDQRNAILDNPGHIQYINKPSEELQKLAIKKSPYAIKHIKNPSQELSLLALNKNPKIFKLIDNPNKAVQLEAVKKRPSLIKYIDNPSENMQLIAVKKSGDLIKAIKNPSEEVQLAAVKENGYSIEYIPNPSEAVQLASVYNGGSLSFIENPTEKVKLEAVKQNGFNIQYIKNPSQKLQLIAIRKTPEAIKYIKNPKKDLKSLSNKLISNEKLKEAEKHFSKGVYYENNFNQEKFLRLPLARTEYSKAARFGLAKAQLKLADMYISGQGGEQNVIEAKNLYLESAKQGNTEAKKRLANFDNLVSKYLKATKVQKTRKIHYDLPSFCYGDRKLSLAEFDHCKALKKGIEEAHKFIENQEKYGDM